MILKYLAEPKIAGSGLANKSRLFPPNQGNFGNFSHGMDLEPGDWLRVKFSPEPILPDR